jgi:hypothetical protein
LPPNIGPKTAYYTPNFFCLRKKRFELRRTNIANIERNIEL